MPSRKRAKGKERRAKAKASFSNLILHDESKCNHFSTSTIPTDDICVQFVQQFEYELNIVYVSLTKSDTRFDAYDKVIQRLKRGNRFNKIWIEEEKQAQLLPLFVSLATNLLLKDEGYLLHRDTGLEPNGFEKGFLSQQANIVVVAAVFSQHEFNTQKVLESKTGRPLLRDLQSGMDYDTIRFCAKHIPCKCLKAIYARIKSEPRLVTCNICMVTKERKDFYLCGNCRYIHYCSVECQRADFPRHRELCFQYP